jgi:nitroreductase
MNPTLTNEKVEAWRKPAPTQQPIHPLIRERWSPRAFSDRPVSQGDLDSLVEAARWAPSSMNEQPWAILIGDRATDPEGHARILATLVPQNAVWAAKAPVLALTVARLTFLRHGRPNRHALFDTGQAIANLSLQATAMGLVLHQMGGFDADKARDLLAIPEGVEPVAAMALGYPGDPSDLPEELRQRELAPRTRRPTSEWAFGAKWGEARKRV